MADGVAPRLPLEIPPGKAHTVPGARIAKEGAIPGYTGFVPAYRNHLIGHSYADSTRRALALTDSLRNHKPETAYHLSTEDKVEGRNFFYAQLAHAGQIDDPKAIKWMASKRETPAEMKYCSGKLDIASMRKCIGTTEKYPKETVKTLTIGDLPYKSVHLVTKKEFETMKDDILEVVEARHHLIGYSGHLHAKQHLFSQSYGKTSRRLRGLPADPYTSNDFIDYQENRPLVVNEFELKHPMKFNHLELLKTGEGNLGPLPEGAR